MTTHQLLPELYKCIIAHVLDKNIRYMRPLMYVCQLFHQYIMRIYPAKLRAYLLKTCSYNTSNLILLMNSVPEKCNLYSLKVGVFISCHCTGLMITAGLMSAGHRYILITTKYMVINLISAYNGSQYHIHETSYIGQNTDLVDTYKVKIIDMIQCAFPELAGQIDI